MFFYLQVNVFNIYGINIDARVKSCLQQTIRDVLN